MNDGPLDHNDRIASVFLKKNLKTSFSMPKLIPLLLMIFVLPPAYTSAAIIYVDDDLGSLNLGTLAEPYTTIQTALDVAGPGDVIQVRDGTYNEKLWWANSGTSENPITLRNFPGETPLLTGTGITGQPQMIIVSSKSFVVIDGLTMQDNYLQEARGIHVTGEGSNITIQNCTITQMGFTSDKSIDPASISPTGQAHGILINGRTVNGYTDITILNNELSCLVTGNSEALTLAGNVSGFNITGNTIFDNTNIGIDIAGHFSWALDEGVAANLNQARNGIVAGNVVYDNRRFSNFDAPAGIYVDGGRDVVIECNTVYRNGSGISIGCENAGKTASGVLVRNNFIYDNDNHGIVLGSNVADINNCIVRNNTCLKNGSVESFTSEISLQNSTSCQILNNILYARTISHYSIGIFAYTANGMTVSHNIMFREGGNLSNLIVAGDGSTAPADLNTLQVDPLLLNDNLSNPDFHLMENSPALNAGSNTNVSVGEEDLDKEMRIANTTVDIGADEVQVALPVVYSRPLSAIGHDTYILLSWATAREVNANRFLVEKLNDEGSWYAIGEVPAGSSEYQYKDESPVPGIRYYRLLQIDWDGKSAYSSIVNARWGGQGTRVYPNPSGGTVQLAGDFREWQLFRQHGQWVRSGNQSRLENLSPGVYIIYFLGTAGRRVERIVVK